MITSALMQFYFHSDFINCHEKSFAAQTPNQFAWLAARGVYVGHVKSSQVTDEAMLSQRSLITNAKLIPYPEIS